MTTFEARDLKPGMVLRGGWQVLDVIELCGIAERRMLSEGYETAERSADPWNGMVLVRCQGASGPSDAWYRPTDVVEIEHG